MLFLSSFHLEDSTRLLHVFLKPFHGVLWRRQSCQEHAVPCSSANQPCTTHMHILDDHRHEFVRLDIFNHEPVRQRSLVDDL